jgi:5S rRNA maturation endonuclease (ribonuclease M5)
VPASRIVATYPYQDEEGRELFQVVRFEPKEFRQRRPDGNGGYNWKLGDVRRVLYRLPELLEALALEQTIFVVEGEKDVQALRRLNIAATCNPGGASKWRDEFSQVLKGARVVVVPDHDRPGHDHAETVARSLVGVAASVKVVNLAKHRPDLPNKADVSDWLAQGGTAEGLHALIDATPQWSSPVLLRLPAIWYGDEDLQPQLSWLVKGLFANSGLSTLIGPPGTSKSFLALDLALHIAHGRPWFGRKVTEGGVVYVTGEGASGMLTRMKAWRKEKQGEPRVPFVLLPTSVNLYDDDEGASALVADIKAHALTMAAPVRLVVLDTLGRMIGTGVEDYAADINRLVHRAERIQSETGAHVLFVHHTGKDEKRGGRGSNNILGASETQIQIWSCEKGIFKASIEKVKDGEAVEPLLYTLVQTVLGVDEDGADITSCYITSSDTSPSVRGKLRLSDIERIAIDALQSVLLDRGQTPPQTIEIPPSIKDVVNVEIWRERAYAKGLTDGTSEARKKASNGCAKACRQSAASEFGRGGFGLPSGTGGICPARDNRYKGCGTGPPLVGRGIAFE